MGQEGERGEGFGERGEDVGFGGDERVEARRIEVSPGGEDYFQGTVGENGVDALEDGLGAAVEFDPFDVDELGF